MDLVTRLSNDARRECFKFLSGSDLVAAGCVSKTWRSLFTEDDQVWYYRCMHNRVLCLRGLPASETRWKDVYHEIQSLRAVFRPDESGSSVSPSSSFASSSPALNDLADLGRASSVESLSSVVDSDGKEEEIARGAMGPDDTRLFQLISRVVSCSSQDHDTQGPDNTLEDDSTFWSSTGSDCVDACEEVVYELVQPLTLLRFVSLFVYRAGFQRRIPIYPPRAVRFHVGFTKDDYHYSSPVFDVEHSHHRQVFNLGPQAVIGGFLKVELIGKVTRQPGDELLYTVLRHIKGMGYPVGAVGGGDSPCPMLSQLFVKHALDVCHRHTGSYTIVRDRMLLAAALSTDPETPASSSGPTPKPDVEEKGVEESAFTIDCQDREELAQLITKRLKVQAESLVEDLHNTARFVEEVRQLWCEGKFQEMGAVMAEKAKVKNVDQRTRCLVLRWINSQCLVENTPKPLAMYVIPFLQNETDLNEEESLSVARSDPRLFSLAWRSGLLTPSTEMGNFFFEQGDYQIALYVYSRAFIPDKLIETTIAMGKTSLLIQYIVTLQYEVDFEEILAKLLELHHPAIAARCAVQIYEAQLCDPDILLRALSIERGDRYDYQAILKQHDDEQQALYQEVLASQNTEVDHDREDDDGMF